MLLSLEGGLPKDVSLLPARPRFEPPSERPDPRCSAPIRWAELDRVRCRCRDVTCPVSVLDVDRLGACSCCERPRLARRVGLPASPGGRSPVPEAHGCHPRGRGGVAGRELERHRAASGGSIAAVDGYGALWKGGIYEPAA